MNNSIDNIGLEELLEVNDISVNTYNICKYNNINTLEKILQYFLENGGFKKLRNCDDISNQELLDICKKYNYFLLHLENKTIERIAKNQLLQTIKTLSIRQENILNNLIFSKFKNLSSRSSKALSSYLDNSINISSINESFFRTPYFDFSILKNVGNTAKIEITSFLKDIKELIERVSKLEDEGTLKRELLTAFLIKQFSVSPETINAICNNYNFNNGIPIFKTINYLINQNYIFDIKGKTVFNCTLGFFQKKIPDTVKNTSKKIGLTIERTRQIRIQLLGKLEYDGNILHMETLTINGSINSYNYYYDMKFRLYHYF